MHDAKTTKQKQQNKNKQTQKGLESYSLIEEAQ